GSGARRAEARHGWARAAATPRGNALSLGHRGGDHDVSRSGRSDLRSDKPSTAETLDTDGARAAAPLLRSSIFADPNPAAPRAAAARDRSSAEPSPQTPPANPRGSVISTCATTSAITSHTAIISPPSIRLEFP